MGKILKYFKENKFEVIISILMIISFFYKIEISIFLLGIILLKITIDNLKLIQRINRNGVKINGKIKEYKKDSDGYKIPFINFSTFDGKIIEKEPNIYFATDMSFFKNYKNKINQDVEITYNKENPSEFLISNEKKQT
jgi:hypothetical protein